MIRLLICLVLALTTVAALPTAASAAFASGLLRALPTTAETTTPAYDRTKFKHWTTLRGCTIRQHVLHRQNTQKTADGCKGTTGSWKSVYDDLVFTSGGLLDVDHMVPLAEAWRSGAATKWDAATRERFANDLSYRPSLIAVSASSNRSKGDQDPAEWTPEVAAFHCRYAVNWIAVKYRWKLAADAVERAALTELMKGCPATIIKLATPPQALITNVKPKPVVTPVVTPPASTGDTDTGYPLQPELDGDQDCSDFDGPVQVLPGDPDGLDRDNDGIGCE